MTDPRLTDLLDGLFEAMLVDLADAPDEEEVPIGRLIVELFEADERGYAYPPDLSDLYLTVGEIRERMREGRARMARESRR